MRMELNIDKAALIRAVRQEYGIDIQSLTFVPEGEVAHGYVAGCADGDRYFLKLLSDSRLGQISATGLDFSLPLAWDLYSRAILPHIAHPIRTSRGHFRTRFEGRPLVLYNFVAGRRVGYELPLPDDVLAKLAGLVGILHRSTPEIGIENRRYERFSIPFERDLVKSLEMLESITSTDRTGQQELQKLLLPRRDEILGCLHRLRELQHLVQAVDQEMVWCHTDLHGGNLIVNDQGDLYILDWEGALIAPPEHDLFAFVDDDRFVGLFLPSYEREFGPASLDSKVFAFYLYRRNLEDLTDWMMRILHENTDDEQDRNDLAGIVEDCISGWPYLETAIGEIEAKLAQGAIG